MSLGNLKYRVRRGLELRNERFTPLVDECLKLEPRDVVLVGSANSLQPTEHNATFSEEIDKESNIQT